MPRTVRAAPQPGYQSPPTANTRYSSAPRPPQPFQQQSSVVALSQIIEYSYIIRSMLISAHCVLPIARQRRVVMNLIRFEEISFKLKFDANELGRIFSGSHFSLRALASRKPIECQRSKEIR